MERRYRLGRRLGAGAMGAVYEALDVTTGRQRAVKVMHAHTLDRDDLRRRFALEARITGRIRSPFIVDVLDAGVDDDGTPYLVMELLHGEDLSRRLKRTAGFGPVEALTYLGQTALALDETHRAGIVHRDLKPANLFLEERTPDPPRVKVLDFGVAKVVVDHVGHTTGVAGTPAYMAPEQFRGGKVGPATDIYAVGMMAFTFLVGSAYWEDESDGVSDVIAFALVAVQGPKEPATRRAARRGVSLPPAFDTWFARCTAIDPSERFSSASAAVTALSEALGAQFELSAAPLGSASEPDSSTEIGITTAGGDDSAPSSTIQSTTAGAEERDSTQTTESATRSTGADRRSAVDAHASTVLAPPEQARALALPVPQARPRGIRRAVAVLGASAALGTAGAFAFLREPPPAPPVSSPLAPPASVIACPVFEASGVAEPAGWLGAAAAATFCERARVVLGGTTARTLVPAQLLRLDVQPYDKLPEDPYADPDARKQSLEAARHGASAYVDGRVIREPSGFRIEIELHRHGGEEMARATGSGRALYEAIREAMTELVEPNRLPQAVALDPIVADFTRAPDVDGALALLDLSFAMAQNAGALPQECARVNARSADFAELGPGEQFRCAYTLGQPAPKVELPPLNPLSPGALAARARVRLMVEGDSDPPVAKELDRLSRGTTGWGRSALAATASCLVQASDPKHSLELALLAVQAEPRNPAGEWCEPWIQLANVTRGTASAEVTLRAWRAWAPWQGYGWLFEATSRGDHPNALAYARRSYLLSPLNTYVAEVLADRLLASGAREEARAVAVAVAAGGYPVHRVESDLLLLRVDASQARFGDALSRAKRAMVISPGDAGWVRVQRLEIGWRALQLGLILGRAGEIADLLVEHFLDPEPSPLDGASIEVPLRIPAICARASTAAAARCFKRFRSLRGSLSLGALPGTDAFVDGAERYSVGNFAGAARAWRSLIQAPGPYVALMADAMIATFEHTGEQNLVALLEAAVSDSGNELNGASLKTVRAARRALQQGDREKARSLAKQVVDAWSVADETVPSVEEMRKLLARKPP